jgi:DNA-binding MarR family transcriptional regulator
MTVWVASRYRLRMAALEQGQYERLLLFRTGLRRFLRWSAAQAESAGLTPTQHQLLLALRGHPDPLGPTVGEVADYLCVRHHSAVGSIDRAQAAGLLERQVDPVDSRVVRLRLTEAGQERLQTLAAAHVEELTRLESQLHALWAGLDDDVDEARAVNG